MTRSRSISRRSDSLGSADRDDGGRRVHKSGERSKSRDRRGDGADLPPPAPKKVRSNVTVVGRSPARSPAQSLGDESPEPEEDENLLKLKVSHLTRNVTDEHLREIFSIFGEIKTAHVAVHPRVRLSKGYGFVEYVSEEHANKARLHMDGAQIDGNDVQATFVTVLRKKPGAALALQTQKIAARRQQPFDEPRRPRLTPSPRAAPRPRLTPQRDNRAYREPYRARSPPRRGGGPYRDDYRRRSPSAPRRRLTPPPRGGRDMRDRPPYNYRSPPRRLERRSPPRGRGFRPRSRSPIARGPIRRTPPRRAVGRSRSRSRRRSPTPVRRRASPQKSRSRSASRRRARSGSYSSRSRSASRSRSRRSRSYSSRSRSYSSRSPSKSRSRSRSKPRPPAKSRSKTPLPGPPPPRGGGGDALPPPPPRT